MAFWNSPWEKIKKKLLRKLRQLNTEFYELFLANLEELTPVMKQLWGLHIEVGRILQNIFDTYARNERIVKEYNDVKKEWNMFGNLMENYCNFLSRQVSDIKGGKIRENWFGDRIRSVKKGRFISLIDDVEQVSDPRRLSEVINVDEQRELYVIKNLESELHKLADATHKHYMGFIRVLDILIKICGQGDRDFGQSWSETHKQNRANADKFYHEAKHELNITIGLLHRFRKKITRICDEAKQELQAISS